jgi:hypothetical protein
MRKHLEATVNAWREGYSHAKIGESSWSNGSDVYSYKTCIMTRTETGEAIVNMSKYSVTTSRLQNELAAEFPDAVFVDGLGFNVDREHLRDAAQVDAS